MCFFSFLFPLLLFFIAALLLEASKAKCPSHHPGNAIKMECRSFIDHDVMLGWTESIFSLMLSPT